MISKVPAATVRSSGPSMSDAPTSARLSAVASTVGTSTTASPRGKEGSRKFSAEKTKSGERAAGCAALPKGARPPARPTDVPGVTAAAEATYVYSNCFSNFWLLFGKL